MTLYRVNGRLVSHEEFLANAKAKSVPSNGEKQRGRRFKVPGLFGDRTDWRHERDAKTGKDGRYCPQMARRPGDPNAVFRSRSELIEKAKQRGYTVDTDG